MSNKEKFISKCNMSYNEAKEKAVKYSHDNCEIVKIYVNNWREYGITTDEELCNEYEKTVELITFI